jgi:hypothetical protein
MIAQLRWVASGSAAPPMELGRLLHRLTYHVRHSSCWLQTQHARAVLQVDRSGRVYLACPDCGHQSRGWQTPWRGSRPVC